ncbi:MAG TPA: RNA-binding S4 domain-containing protein [Acholeplasmataceae bacterium]|nr:RNA-binding S4 domain-containing protein [Acholeplasmataceae bacterium]
MNEFIMIKPVITLTQFLKANDYISSGGEAKYFLSEYVVKINNIIEDRRGKKLYPGDIVIIVEDEYKLVYDQED